jgi:hypothetical protein
MSLRKHLLNCFGIQVVRPVLEVRPTLDKYYPNSGESYVDHYIRYENLASTLRPTMTDMDLLSAHTSHFEPKVEQGLICGNFQNKQDTLAFLTKYQGLGENRDSFRSPRRDNDRRDVSRRTQENPHRDEGQRDHGNNRRQTDHRSGRYNSDHQINQDGRNFNGRAQGRVVENETRRLNPTAPRFNPRDEMPPVGRSTGSERDRSDNAQNLNN